MILISYSMKNLYHFPTGVAMHVNQDNCSRHCESALTSCKMYVTTSDRLRRYVQKSASGSGACFGDLLFQSWSTHQATHPTRVLSLHAFQNFPKQMFTSNYLSRCGAKNFLKLQKIGYCVSLTLCQRRVIHIYRFRLIPSAKFT